MALLTEVSQAVQLKDMALDYLKAGSDIITTATYQVTKEALCEEHSLNTEEAYAVMRSAVNIIDRARSTFWADLPASAKLTRRYPAIAASLGPMAAVLENESEYEGAYKGLSKRDFENFHSDRIISVAADAHAGASDTVPDILAFETIPSATEAAAIAHLMKTEPRLASFPFWISFQCKDDLHIANGTRLEKAVVGVLTACDEGANNLVAIGVNCVSPNCVPRLVEIVRQSIAACMAGTLKAPWPVEAIAYPNSGEVWSETKWTSSGAVTDSDTWARELLKSNARFVGGCCRTGPSQIASLCACLSRNKD